MIGLGNAKEWCSEKFYQEEACASAENAPGPGFEDISGGSMAQAKREPPGRV
jgi:hypothetical protein